MFQHPTVSFHDWGRIRLVKLRVPSVVGSGNQGPPPLQGSPLTKVTSFATNMGIGSRVAKGMT